MEQEKTEQAPEIVGYFLKNNEMEALLNYLSYKPWIEVNDVLQMLLQKVKPTNTTQ